MATDIPKWLSSYIDQAGLDSIENVVHQEEARTNGEIVPMVVHKSSTLGHVPFVVILSLSVLYLGFDLYHFQLEQMEWPLWLFGPLNFILLLVLTKALSSLEWVARILTPRPDQLHQVEQRALTEFYNVRVHHTGASTGILIFVSLLERQIVVLGDDPIAEKLPEQEWRDMIDVLRASLKKKDLAGGFEKALVMAGEKLATHFPKSEGNPNELANHLIIKE